MPHKIEKNRLRMVEANGQADVRVITNIPVSFSTETLVEELVKKYGLTENQTWWLMYRPKFSTDIACCNACGVAYSTVKDWVRRGRDNSKLPQFHLARAELFRRICEMVQGDMEALAAKATQRVEELLDAETVIFDKEGNERVIPDHDARFKGIQALYHWLGKWGGQPKVDINPTYVSITDEFTKLLANKQQALLAEGKWIEQDNGDTDSTS